MSQINVNRAAVQSRTTQLRGEIRSSIADLESRYRQIKSNLGELDSATNAGVIKAAENNMKKAAIAAETLVKLFSFMENSSMQVEIQDRATASSMRVTR